MRTEAPFTGRLAQVYKVLSAELPPVTLLLGDYFLEYGAMIGALVTRYRVESADVLHLRSPFSADDARAVALHLQVAPFGPFKLVLAIMDGASEQAQNVLLKVLEEPPGDARFLLMASQPPLETIVSRAQVFRFGVQLRQEEADSEDMGKVAAAVRAAMSGDHALLLAACEGFQARHLAMLGRWAASQSRPELSQLTPGQPEGPLQPEVPVATARKVLAALSSVSHARPVNAAVAALSAAFD